MASGLTIVVPVWNREHLVVRTLDSIVGGSLLPDRLIIVDNASSDGSLRVCREWAAAHDELMMDITVLEEHRAGAACARNRGLSDVKTDWIYFFDSDDEFDSHFVEDVMKEFVSSKHSECDIVFVPTRQVVDGRPSVRAYHRPLTVAGQILSSMLSTQNVVFRSEWLRRLGGWNEELTTWDDWELGVRVAMADPCVLWLTRRAYHNIFVHDKSLTGPNYVSRKGAIVKALRAVASDVCGKREWGRAVFFRAQIVAGMMERDGDDAIELLRLVQDLLCDVSPLHRVVGWILRKYVGIGGHGGWRLALQLL